MDIVDLGSFPAVNYWFLWLTILIPIALFVGVCFLLAKIRFKDKGTAGALGFGAFFILLLAGILSSYYIGRDLEETRYNQILQGVEDKGYTNVVDLSVDEPATISANDKDGYGHLYVFIDLPNEHVGLVEWTDK